MCTPHLGVVNILSDRGGEFSSKQLGFIKVYTSPHTLTGNSVIEQTHAYLKTSLRKLICTHNIDLDEQAPIATMAYEVLPHSSAERSSTSFNV